MVRCVGRRWRGALAALGLALFVTGCGAQDVQAEVGQTIQTALLDFTVTDPEVLDAYPGVTVPDGDKLVRLWLTVKNTSDQTYTMFAQDFQLQWGPDAEDFGVCLTTQGEGLLPDSYELPPGKSRSGAMLAAVPQDCTALTVAYAERDADGQRVAAYFVAVPL